MIFGLQKNPSFEEGVDFADQATNFLKIGKAGEAKHRRGEPGYDLPVCAPSKVAFASPQWAQPPLLEGGDLKRSSVFSEHVLQLFWCVLL